MFKRIRFFFYMLVFALLLTCRGEAMAEMVSLSEELTVIEEHAFYGVSSITTAVLPEGILEIQDEAFAYSGLEQINLPSSLRHIADNAFEHTPLKRVSAGYGTYAYNWAVEHGYLSAATDPSLFNYSAPSRDTVSITGFVDRVNYPDKIVLPERSDDGYLITGISDSAFSGCTGLTSVYIPGNVKTIGQNAFRGCSELTELILCEGVTKIAGTVNYVNGAFAYCSKLESVVIPASMQAIDNRAFYGCTGLTSLIICNSTEVTMSIGSEAFRETKLAKKITIPAKVSAIGSYAFAGTPITELKIEAGSALTAIGEGAFEACRNLTTVAIPANVQTISARAFIDCVGLSNLTLNEGLVTIGGTVNYINGAFANCTSLVNVSIPSTVKTIDNAAFYHCTSLTSLTLRNSSEVAMTIGNEAFRGTGLAEVLTIPSKVSGVGKYAFAETPITKLVLENSEYLKAIWDSAFEGCVRLISANIPGNIQTLGSRAFYGCKALVDLTLNEGLVTIGGTVNYVNGAFANCTSLVNVSIPSTVQTIGNAAFYHCTSLTSLTLRNSSEVAMIIGNEAFRGTGLAEVLTIPSKVSGVGKYAFAETSITKLVLENSEYLKAIGDSAFEGCVQLTSANIPGNIQTLGARAFFGCKALVDLNLNEGLVTIGGTVNYVNGAFANCTSLASVIIPSTVKQIDNRAFHGCVNLVSLTILDSSEVAMTIGTEAFVGTSLAGELTIPAKVGGIGNYSFTGTLIDKLFIETGTALTRIGEGAFESCANLRVVEIPGNVQTISARAFINCYKLETLSLNEGLVTIDGMVNYINGAFANCTSLERIVFPSTIQTLGKRVFYNCTSLSEILFKCPLEEVQFGTEAFYKCPGVPVYVE